MSKDEFYGTLREKAHRKKKVDVWTFYSPFSDKAARDAGYNAVIELRNGYSEGLHFAAMSPHFPGALKDTDIKRLREKVERAFRMADMAARDIKWEDWIEIEMDETHNFRDEHGVSLNVQWRFLKRGVHPVSGEAFTIHHSNNVVIPFPKAKLAGEHDHGKGDREWHQHDRDVGTQFSYIPATAPNVAALEALAERITASRTRLRDLLNQKQIQISLTAGVLAQLEKPK